MSEPTVDVLMPRRWLWLLRIGCPVLGFGLGFAVGPVVRWLVTTIGPAPGPLKVLASLPTGWAVLVTTVLGVAAGVWLAWTARAESLRVTVGAGHVVLSGKGDDLHLTRADVASVGRDGKDLVLADARGAELARRDASDLLRSRLHAAFAGNGWPWDGGSGRDERFRPWVDGDPDLDAGAHDVLRARSRALTDDRRGTADELRERLQGLGVVVRDRDGAQEFRLLTSS